MSNSGDGPIVRAWSAMTSVHRLTLLLGVALVGCGSVWLLAQQLDGEINRIQIEGELTSTERAAVRGAIVQAMEGRPAQLHSIDLGVIRKAVDQLTWSERVSVRRQWPDTLRVQLSKRGVAARWGDGGYVATNGSLIQPAANLATDDLPLLDCALSSAARAMEVYQLLSTKLSLVGLRVIELRESQLGEWSIQLRGGFAVVLGKEDLAGRLQRFLAVYAVDLERRANEIVAVDARYHNGIAVSWQAQRVEVAVNQAATR